VLGMMLLHSLPGSRKWTLRMHLRMKVLSLQLRSNQCRIRMMHPRVTKMPSLKSSHPWMDLAVIIAFPTARALPLLSTMRKAVDSVDVSASDSSHRMHLLNPDEFRKMPYKRRLNRRNTLKRILHHCLNALQRQRRIRSTG
jgi:hypothetical protein